MFENENFRDLHQPLNVLGVEKLRIMEIGRPGLSHDLHWRCRHHVLNGLADLNLSLYHKIDSVRLKEKKSFTKKTTFCSKPQD